MRAVATRGRPRTYHPDRPTTNAEYQRRFVQQRTEELQQLRRKLAQNARFAQIWMRFADCGKLSA